LIVGIDYGAKLAGTTVICYAQPQGKINFLASEKKKNADSFIISFVREHSERLDEIFLDAPLSLPQVYSRESNNSSDRDFFYRRADREMNAMSPMFLGGLTARAMKLSFELSLYATFIETYPKALIKHLSIEEKIDISNYKKEKEEITQQADRLSRLELLAEFELITSEIITWHHFDALLAFSSAQRHKMQRSISVGDELEGCIHY